MDIREIDQRLNDMWNRLQRPSAPAGGVRPPAGGPVDLAAAERDLLRATLAELRRNFEREKDRWRALLDQRDEAVRAVTDEKKWLEGEAARVRGELEGLRGEFQQQQELQALEKAEFEADLRRRTHRQSEELGVYERQLRETESAHREEVARLEESLARWKDEEKAWYKMLEEKNQALADLNRRLNELGLERQKDRAALEEQKRAADATLREKTAQLAEERRVLSGLLQAREAEIANFQRMLALSQQEIVDFTRGRHQLETELKAANEQSLRLQNEIKALRDAWEVERGHWRELWERERASRERWYDDMRDWEDHLRQEREDWLRQFRGEAAAAAASAPPVARQLPSVVESPFARPPLTPLQLRRRRFAAVAALAGVAFAAALAVSAVRSASPKEWAAPGEHFSGLAAHGGHLYFCDWMTGQIVQSSARRPSEILHHGVPDASFHPVALRWAEGRLWALDPWSRLIQEHQGLAPFAAAGRWSLQEENPVDMAWDGQGFWVLDGGTALRRHLLGALDAVEREAALPGGWRLSALDFRDGEFWAYDEAAGVLRRFRIDGETVVPLAEGPLPAHARAASPLTALALSESSLWTASEKSVTLFRWSSWSLRMARLFKK